MFLGVSSLDPKIPCIFPLHLSNCHSLPRKASYFSCFDALDFFQNLVTHFLHIALGNLPESLISRLCVIFLQDQAEKILKGAFTALLQG